MNMRSDEMDGLVSVVMDHGGNNISGVVVVIMTDAVQKYHKI
jgi:hypothetical protein